MVSDKYFLASNSAEGFVSYFDSCYDVDSGWRAYIIKGGPGTGKSSFMKTVIKRATNSKIPTDEIYCASDPDSLDGIILPTRKIVFLDGTSPHVVEPKCPGACETLLDFGKFWDESKLALNRELICELSLKNKHLHKKAGRFIAAAGSLLEDELFQTTESDKKIKETAQTIAEKYLVKRNAMGREWRRFSFGITPKGLLQITGAESFKNNVAVEGSKGFTSGVIENLKEIAISEGYEIITLKNPILPSKLNDGLVIPELSLYVSSGLKNALNDTINGLIESVAEILTDAKKNHDELEKLYIDAMDFKALGRYGDEVIEEIFS